MMWHYAETIVLNHQCPYAAGSHWIIKKKSTALASWIPVVRRGSVGYRRGLTRPVEPQIKSRG